MNSHLICHRITAGHQPRGSESLGGAGTGQRPRWWRLFRLGLALAGLLVCFCGGAAMGGTIAVPLSVTLVAPGCNPPFTNTGISFSIGDVSGSFTGAPGETIALNYIVNLRAREQAPDLIVSHEDWHNSCNLGSSFTFDIADCHALVLQNSIEELFGKTAVEHEEYDCSLAPRWSVRLDPHGFIKLPKCPLVAGDDSTITAELIPADALDGAATWSSSDTNVCQVVGSDGSSATLMAGLTNGTVMLRAENTNGCYLEVQVKVEAAEEGGGCASGGCGGASSLGGRPFGAAAFSALPGYMTFSMGRDRQGASFSPLRLSVVNQTGQGFNPVAYYPGLQAGADVVYSNGIVYQIRVPEGLAMIEYPNGDPYECWLRFFASSNVGGRTVRGYPVSGDALVQYSMEWNSGSALPRSIEESRPNQANRTYLCGVTSQGMIATKLPGVAGYELTRVTNVNSRTTMSERWSSPSSSTNDATAYSSRRREVWDLLRHVAGVVERNGDTTNELVKTYYSPSGLLQQETRPDGSWTYYEYDSAARPLRVYSAAGNQAPTSNAALARVTEYTYTNSVVAGSGDVASISPSSARRVVESVQGQIVGLTYRVHTLGEVREIRCLETNAAWNASTALVTVQRYYTNGQFEGDLKSVSRPDGTLDLYEYGRLENYVDLTNAVAIGTNCVYSGQPNSTLTAVTNGTCTTTVTGPYGVTLGRTVEQLALAAGGGVSRTLVEQTLYSDFDSAHRPRTTVTLGGTNTADYACCGEAVSTDRDGAVTYREFDSLGRLEWSALNGITNATVYDAAGRVAATVRYGTNGAAITNSQRFYDLGGNLIRSLDALNHETVYTNYADAAGQQVRLTTYPGGATRQEVYYRDGMLKEISGSAAHPVSYAYGFADDNGVSCQYTRETRPAGGVTNETTTYTDLLGRTVKRIYAGLGGSVSYEQSAYDSAGRLFTQRDRDGRIVGYKYNGLGEVECVTNAPGRVTRTLSAVASTAEGTIRRSERQVLTNGQFMTVSTLDASVDGRNSWTASLGLESATAVVSGGQGWRTNIAWAPDSSWSCGVYYCGRLVSNSRCAPDGSSLSQQTFVYDAHGRRSQVIDAALGTTVYDYDNMDRVVSVTEPGVAPRQSVYDARGRVAQTVQPDGTTLTNTWLSTGELYQTAGGGAYPVRYAYDPQGRMTNLTTWQDFSGQTGAAATGFGFDARGYLASKRYADNQGIDYAYTNSGRLLTRAWARGTATAYGYNEAGELATVAYSDGATAGYALEHDVFGRVTRVTTPDGATVLATRVYSEFGDLVSETADGLTVTNQYDDLRRRTNVAVYAGSTLLSATGYSYDGASRLDIVSDAVHSARYEYLTNSSRAGTVTFKNNGQTVMTTTREYDSTNRLKRVASATASGAPVYSALYTYDAAGRRIQATAAPDNTRWDYGYDSLGQVTSGRKYWCDGSFVAGQQFEYAFDTIGNRKWTKAGGDLSGGSLRTALYTNNLLNQITARQVPGSVDVQGIAQSAAAVTVNGQAVLRQGEYYAKTLTWNTATGAVCAWVTNIASLAGQSTTNIGNLYLARNPETNAFDADGNLKEDARWKYTWDAENRLVKMMSRGAPTNLGMVLMFTYDWQGRRASKVVSNWTGAAWALASNVRFVYDGWNLLAELNATNNGVIRSYAWGTDASGSNARRGRRGRFALGDPLVGQFSTHFTCYDGNHNVMALVNAATGETSAQYEYGPFHELLRATGPMAREKTSSSPPQNTRTGRRAFTIMVTGITPRAQESG